jgi:hypothetical protein
LQGKSRRTTLSPHDEQSSEGCLRLAMCVSMHRIHFPCFHEVRQVEGLFQDVRTTVRVGDPARVSESLSLELHVAPFHFALTDLFRTFLTSHAENSNRTRQNFYSQKQLAGNGWILRMSRRNNVQPASADLTKTKQQSSPCVLRESGPVEACPGAEPWWQF